MKAIKISLEVSHELFGFCPAIGYELEIGAFVVFSLGEFDRLVECLVAELCCSARFVFTMYVTREIS